MTAYLPTAFGATQKRAFVADFAKLPGTPAAHTFLFVTDRRAYEVCNVDTSTSCLTCASFCWESVSR